MSIEFCEDNHIIKLSFCNLKKSFEFTSRIHVNGKRIDLKDCENFSVKCVDEKTQVTCESKELEVKITINILDCGKGFVVELVAQSDNNLKCEKIEPIIQTNSFDKNVEFTSYPFDNDAWIRCENINIDVARESYEIAVIDSFTFVTLVGSVTQEKWKTAILPNKDKIQVVCGFTSDITRDSIPHNIVQGNRICSEKIYITYGNNRDDVFEKYSQIAKKYVKPLSWNGEKPLGFNSFSAFPNNVSKSNFEDASVFFNEYFKKANLENITCNINYDFETLSYPDKKLSVEIAKGNSQNAGFYYAPFACFESDERLKKKLFENEDYTFDDILLRDSKGKALLSFDGLLSLDPTHPLSVKRAEIYISKHAQMGFNFIKLDFLAHASREGAYYDKSIMTGRQAYNFGMGYLREISLKHGLFISSSIDTLLPYGFCHARRICCDCFGTVQDSEYLLNSLTHLYFLHNNLYQYNDADHIVLCESFKHPRTSENEAKTRFVASLICGSILTFSDNYGNIEVQNRFNNLLYNKEIIKIINSGKTFIPCYFPKGNIACDEFCCEIERSLYIAVFNFGETAKQCVLDLSKYNNFHKFSCALEIYENVKYDIEKDLKFKIESNDVKIFKLF